MGIHDKNQYPQFLGDWHPLGWRVRVGVPWLRARVMTRTNTNGPWINWPLPHDRRRGRPCWRDAVFFSRDLHSPSPGRTPPPRLRQASSLTLRLPRFTLHSLQHTHSRVTALPPSYYSYFLRLRNCEITVITLNCKVVLSQIHESWIAEPWLLALFGWITMKHEMSLAWRIVRDEEWRKDTCIFAEPSTSKRKTHTMRTPKCVT